MALWVDDQMAFAASTIAAGNAAIGAWVRLSAWSSAQRSDGVVPRALAYSMASPEELAALVRVGLALEEPEAYMLPGYLDLNPTREKVLADREARRAGGKLGAARRWSPHGTTHGTTDDSTHTSSHGSTHGASQSPLPSPAPPDLPLALSGESPTTTSTKSRRRPLTPAPDTTDEPSLEAFCAKWKLDSRDPEVLLMLDTHRGKGNEFRDWSSTWRTWQRRDQKFARANGHRNGAFRPQPAPQTRGWKPGDEPS